MNTVGKLISLSDSPRKTTFTKWEQDFIASVDQWIEENDSLTEKQIQVVENMYDKYFS